jgi:hypothetical protein
MVAAPKIRRSATAFALFALVAALTVVSAVPAMAAAPGDGHGAMSISPSSVTPSSTTTFTMTFTAGTSQNSAGAHVAVTVPAGWTTPTTAAGAGHVVATNVDCSSAGPASVSGMTIDVPMKCGNGKQFTITYATATAPSSQGVNTFYTQSAGGGGGTALADIAVQPTVTVAPPIDHFNVSAPATATAGSAFSATVTAKDATNATITVYTGTVHFSSSDGSATLPSNYTFVLGDNGVHTFTNEVTLVTVGTQSVGVNDSVATSVVGSADVDVASAVDHFDISAPATSPARSPFTVTVTAMDASDDPVTDYAGTVHFTSSDGSATLPNNYTFVGGDNGSHTFTNGVTLQTVGTQSVKVRDTLDNSINGTTNVAVTRVKHARTITLRLRGSLRAVGRVRAVDGFAMCVDTVKVSIQRWVSGRWIVVKRLRTRSTGRYRVQLVDRPGKYRAVARRIRSAQDVCRKAVSPTRRNI